jgi:hypothetical protein
MPQLSKKNLTPQLFVIKLPSFGAETTINHWCSQQYEKHWNEGDTTSTNNEK